MTLVTRRDNIISAVVPDVFLQKFNALADKKKTELSNKTIIFTFFISVE